MQLLFVHVKWHIVVENATLISFTESLNFFPFSTCILGHTIHVQALGQLLA
jgi:hypothetical protein